MSDTSLRQSAPCSGEVLAAIRIFLNKYPLLADKIVRQFLYALHEDGVVTIEQIYEDAARETLMEAPLSPEDEDPNAASGRIWSAADRRALETIVLRHASRHFDLGRVGDLVNLVQKREKASSLEDIANLPKVSSAMLASALKDFCSLPVGGLRLRPAEAMGTRVALIRQFISDQLDFIRIAKHHFTIRFMEEVVDRCVYTRNGSGRIGGKAAGLTLARAILEADDPEDPVDFSEHVAYPDSWFVSTEVCEAFISENDFHEFRSHKYKDLDEIDREFRLVRDLFRNAHMPTEVVSKLRQILEEVGEWPIIVRSSSLLEDNFGSAFPGKYASIFLGNQGSTEDRLAALVGAIAEVYASVFASDPIEYRRQRDLIDYDESMGILIQKVVGRRHGRYFLPLYGGVGFSLNEARWSKRLKREDGLLRLVMGLGTRAVDRVGSDYPRLVPLTMPTLRPEVGLDDIRRYSQKVVDVIDLEKNRFANVDLEEALGDQPILGLHRVVSVEQDGMLTTPGTRLVDMSRPLVVTFERLCQDRETTELFKAMLRKLERYYGCPVDIEFAHDGEKLYLLQCRPLGRRIERERVSLPAGVKDADRVFTADRYVTNGLVTDIEYVFFVDPLDYDAVSSYADKVRVGRVVAALNRKLSDRRFILVGPGRWGSSNIDLGIKVRYADINHSRMLIEVARVKGGMVPDVSFGTHFFQDLVEGGIFHLALYPERQGIIFNEDFLRGSANSLAEVAPDFADLQDRVRLIHVPAVTGGRHLHVAMDGEQERALAYLG